MSKWIIAVILLLSAGFSFSATAQDDDKKTKDGLFEKKGDKERVYNVPLDTLWSASMKAAAEENAIEYSNEKEGIITFSTGQSKASWGFKISVSLSKVDDSKTRIKLVTKKSGFQLVRWGAEGRRVKEFFQALDKKIKTNKP